MKFREIINLEPLRSTAFLVIDRVVFGVIPYSGRENQNLGVKH